MNLPKAVVCTHGPPGAVDLLDPRDPDAVVVHFTASGWAEFVTAVKAGAYDTVNGADGHTVHLPNRTTED